MTATADLIIERRQMRRRLALWRILAIVAVIGAMILAIATLTGVRGLAGGGGGGGGDHVAVVEIGGVITSDAERSELLEKLAEEDAVKAVIVRLSSPGGTVTGSEELYNDLRAIAAEKPVAAEMIDVAASGGYIAAIGTDYIVARSNTITGSIGVVAEGPNISEFLADNGVSVIKIKSSPLKAEPGFLTAPPPEAIEEQRRLIEDSYQWFRGLVGERRDLEGAALDAVADGRVHTGRLALDLGLIDAVGERDAVDAWLEETHEIDPDLDRRARKWGEEELPWFLRAMTRATGLDSVIESSVAPAAARLTPGFRLMAIMY
ncbi:MAG: signal peptide peptidase SppA [Pseudomonadota bacterium]